MVEVQPVRDETPLFTIRFSIPFEYGCIREAANGQCRSEGFTFPQNASGTVNFWPNIAGIWQRIQSGTLPSPIIQINYNFSATSIYSPETTLTLTNTIYLNTAALEFHYYFGNFGGAGAWLQCPGNDFLSSVYATYGECGASLGYCFGSTKISCTNGQTYNAIVGREFV